MSTPQIHERRSIAFRAADVMLRGWLYVPSGQHGPFPAVVMAHGYGALKEMYLDRYAERFAAAGFAVLAYDHRGFGESDGEPRQEIDPWRQIEDFRHAITHASQLELVDEQRIGVWGSSYSGGHALVLGATDRRVKCVVAQVPTIDGTQSALRRVSGDKVDELLRAFAEDRKRRATDDTPARLAIVPDDTHAQAAFSSADAIDWYTAGFRLAPHARNEITLRSVEFARGYNPGTYAALVSPTPLLMIVAGRDHVTPTDLALHAYNHALEPKRLMLLPKAGHFDVYVNEFDSTASAATDWFIKHLANAA